MKFIHLNVHTKLLQLTHRNPITGHIHQSFCQHTHAARHDLGWGGDFCVIHTPVQHYRGGTHLQGQVLGGWGGVRSLYSHAVAGRTSWQLKQGISSNLRGWGLRNAALLGVPEQNITKDIADRCPLDWVTVPSHYFYTGVGFISFPEIGYRILNIFVNQFMKIFSMKYKHSKFWYQLPLYYYKFLQFHNGCWDPLIITSISKYIVYFYVWILTHRIGIELHSRYWRSSCAWLVTAYRCVPSPWHPLSSVGPSCCWACLQREMY